MTLDWVRDDRLSLADLLESLADHEWRAASLCDGWTVHDVAAHLTLSTRDTLGSTLKGLVKARFSWDRANARAATDRAARYDRHELVAQLRETAGSTRRSPGAKMIDALVDTLVHGQDITVPLGRVRPIPAEQACAALEHMRGNWFWGSPYKKTRLIATDCDWSFGEGPEEVRGPVADLLMSAAGRNVGRDRLETSL